MAVLVGWVAVGDGAYRVDYVLGGQVVSVGDLSVSGWLFMSLRSHDAIALDSQLHARKRVDGIVDAVMTGNPTSKHLAVGGIDDGIDGERRDIAATKQELGIRRRWRCFVKTVHARFDDDPLKKLVLQGEEFDFRRPGWASVHKRAEDGE